jgi:hypothetical protein
MARLVSRDPFARGELHAERVHHPGQTCAFCGQVRTTRNGRPWLYQFSWQSDGGRSAADSKLFCSRTCRQSYFGF